MSSTERKGGGAVERPGRRNGSIRALDLFCGAGGSSIGAKQAGVHVVAAVDAWSLAADTYRDNFKGVKVYNERCESVSPRAILRALKRIDLIIASPECTSHTCARGGRRRSEQSRATAMQVVRFARVLKPRWILVENVVSMRRWKKYRRWLQDLTDLGYHHREHVLNAASFGVPQSRRRLFLLFDNCHELPSSVSGKTLRRLPARSIVDTNGSYEFSDLYSPQRADATLARAERAMASLPPGRAFLLVYYGSDGAGGWQRLDAPLRTITTVDRFALVRKRSQEYEMRMLQVAELKAAMGFPRAFKLSHGTRRDKIKLLGNAVCPPVVRTLIRDLLRGGRNGHR
jgi:DNA (cytosine-5)-methyltransferase 1